MVGHPFFDVWSDTLLRCGRKRVSDHSVVGPTTSDLPTAVIWHCGRQITRAHLHSQFHAEMCNSITIN